MGFWNSISTIGSNENDSGGPLRKIRLINQMCFLASVTTLGFVPYLYLVGNKYYSGVQLTATVLSGLSILLNRFRLFKTGLLWVFVTIFLNIFYASLELPGSGVEYFLVPLAMIPFIVFNDRTTCFVMLTITAAAFALSWWLKKDYTPHELLPEHLTRLTFMITSTTTFLLCAVIIMQFKIANDDYEQLIHRQRDILAEKNREISDSVNYAKRIQQASLPDKAEIQRAFAQSFVLFRPKDIVSGDFYFFAENHNRIFIAAADCTGHGVPGALMSMIGAEKLSGAVSESKDPGEILSLLSRGIKTSLRQSGGEESTRDGMDIALCCVDAENGTLRYAGANRPLWIIRKESSELEEIKATKQAIGGTTGYEQSFAMHTVAMKPGDTFYIASDGYADQDGGDKGKKLMTKNFKQLLLDIRQKTMPEQEKHLAAFMDTWRGNREQLDDILVIGVRF